MWIHKNPRALTVLAILLIGVGLGLYEYISQRNDPAYYKARGQAAMAKGNYREAARNFVSAISINPNDAALYVMFGDAMHDSQSIGGFEGKDRAAWERAIEIDPANVEAHRRLMQLALNRVDHDRSAEAFDELQKRAAAVSQLRPKDLSAQEWTHIAAIMSGLIRNDSDGNLEIHCAALRKLMALDPENADLPFYIDLVELHRAQLCRDREQFDRADNHFKFAAALIARPTRRFFGPSSRYIRTTQIFMMIAESEGHQAARRWFPDWLYDPKAVAELAAHEPAAADKVTAAALAAATEDQNLPAAERLCRDAIARNPADCTMRIYLSHLLRYEPAQMYEALDILRLPNGSHLSLDASSRIEQSRLLIEHGNLSLRVAESQSSNQHDELLRAAKEDCRQALTLTGRRLDALKLQARIQIVQNDPVGALATLDEIDRAVHPGASDLQSELLRARAEWMRFDFQKSNAILERLRASRLADSDRVELIQLLLDRAMFSDAFAEIDSLESEVSADRAQSQTLPSVLLENPDTRQAILQRIADALHFALINNQTETLLRMKCIEADGLLRPVPQSQIEKLLKDAEADPVLASNPDWFHIHALLLLSEDRPDDAAQMIARALQRSATEPKFLNTQRLIQASCACAHHDSTAASQAIDSALMALPDESSIARRRALLQVRHICQTMRISPSPAGLTSLEQYQGMAPDDIAALELLSQFADPLHATLYADAAYRAMVRSGSSDLQVEIAHASALLLDDQVDVGLGNLMRIADQSELTNGCAND